MSIVTELNIFTDLSNEHCTLEFDLGDNVISGDEVIVTDDFIVKCNDRDFTNLEYYLKLRYYYIPADIDNSRTGEIPIERLIRLEEGNNTISFDDYPVYLSSDCELVIKDIDEDGYKTATTQVKLTSSETSIYSGDEITLTAKVTTNGLPVISQTVTFKDGATTLGTTTTDINGIATYTTDDLTTEGTHDLTAIYSTYTSKHVHVEVIEAPVMLLGINGSSFNVSNPFRYNGNLIVEWGDGTIETYNEGLSHSYAGSGSHTIKIRGAILSINANSFTENRQVTSVVIPESVDTIKSNAFRKCLSLTSISLSNTVTSIEGYAFSMTKLSSVTIPSSVTLLEEGLFFLCDELTNVSLPNTLTYIGDRVFYNCQSLRSINIPKNVVSMGEKCFYNCIVLADVTLNWDSSDEIPTYESSWFINVSSSIKFSIPNGTTNLYTNKGYPSNKLVERT